MEEKNVQTPRGSRYTFDLLYITILILATEHGLRDKFFPEEFSRRLVAGGMRLSSIYVMKNLILIQRILLRKLIKTVRQTDDKLVEPC